MPSASENLHMRRGGGKEGGRGGEAHVATAAVKVESTFPKRAARHPGRPWRLRRQLVAVGGAATHLYGV